VAQSFTTRYKSEPKIFILQLLSRFFITLYQQNKFEKYKASRITIDQFYRFKQKIAQADRSGSRKSWGMESRKKRPSTSKRCDNANCNRQNQLQWKCFAVWKAMHQRWRLTERLLIASCQSDITLDNSDMSCTRSPGTYSCRRMRGR